MFRGFAIGPAMGGFLYEYGGYGAPFYCCAAFAALNFLAIVWIPEPDHKKGPVVSAADQAAAVDEASPLLLKKTEESSVNMWSLCKNWRILCCVLATIVSASVFSGIEPALPIHLEKVYNASASTVGGKTGCSLIPFFV